MAVEYTDVVAAFITERLKNDPTMDALISGRVYRARLPQAKDNAERDALYPCVVFWPSAIGRFLKTNGNFIVWSPSEYQVVGMDHWYNSFTNLTPIAARIHQLLDGFMNTVTGGGYINSCDCIRPIEISEERFNWLGRLVKIKARLSAS